MRPLVSIIVPVYNTQEYIADCIESIIKQNYDNLEILVINDCSTDNSEEIISQLQTGDGRIKYIKNEANLGLGETRNKGIESATGEYIMFVDSDDSILYGTIKECITLIEEHKSDLIEFGFQYVKEEERNSSLIKTERIKIKKYNIDLEDRNIINIEREIDHISCNKMYSSEIIHNKKLRFKTRCFEDTSFTREYLFNCKVVTITNQKYYNYLVRRDSITKAKFNIQKIDGLIAGVNHIFCVLEQYQLLSLLSKRYVSLFRKNILSIHDNSDNELFKYFVHQILTENILHLKLFISIKYDRLLLRKALNSDLVYFLYSKLYIGLLLFIPGVYSKGITIMSQ